MEQSSSATPDTGGHLLPDRKTWQEPRIVLERSLEAEAQSGTPWGPGQGFLGPLSLSYPNPWCQGL